MMRVRQHRARIGRIAAAGSLLPATGIAVVQPVAQPSVLADTLATRNVLLVGNAVAETVSFIDGSAFVSLGAFSVIPDPQQVFASWTQDADVYDAATGQVVKVWTLPDLNRGRHG
jgi:hypothetical protein